MERTTHRAVAEALEATRGSMEDERLARRAFRCAEGRRRIVTAAGIDAAALSEHRRRILDWLAGYDEPPIEGIVELVAATKVAAEHASQSVEVDRRSIARRSSDAGASDDESSSGRP